MQTHDSWKPKNQLDCDHWNALREYEAANKVWMNTSVFTDAGKEAKRLNDLARTKYEIAYTAANPAHILL